MGQGDAVLVRSPEGKTALVDAGPGVDLVPRLRALGVDTLDLVVASHAHADHIGGMQRVLRRVPVRNYMDNGLPYTTATYRNVLRELTGRRGITYLRATPRTLTLGSVTIEVLPVPESEDDQNNRSVALLVRYGAFVALLSGDSERRELGSLVEEGAIPPLTLLKAPHHGSGNGLTSAFLRAASPRVVVISVGKNDYGHPHPDALAAYAATGARVLRTDRDGQITIEGARDGGFTIERSAR